CLIASSVLPACTGRAATIAVAAIVAQRGVRLRFMESPLLELGQGWDRANVTPLDTGRKAGLQPRPGGRILSARFILGRIDMRKPPAAAPAAKAKTIGG